MRNMAVFCALGLALVAAQPVAPALAAAGDQTASAGVQAAARPAGNGLGVVAHRSGTVVGTAWRHDNSPLVSALLRLRNLTTGRVVMGASTDEVGRFSFPHVPPGSYIVELVDEAGSIRAVGQMLTVGSGDTVATFIRLANRAGFFDKFFGNAAAAALATAASLGVTAVGDGGQPASARF